MDVPQADSRLERLFPPNVETDRFAVPSRLENEVTALFDQFRTPLLRYLSSFGLSPHDAEEVVQEVFLSLFLHLREGKSRSNIQGWIFRVAHNLGLKRRETNHRALRIVSGATGSEADSQIDAAPDPEAQLSSLQRRKSLLAIVDGLPETDRRCLYLRAEGLRYRDIAEAVGLSLGGVALSLARSLGCLSRTDRS